MREKTKKRVLAYEQVPQWVSEAMIGLRSIPLIILLLIDVLPLLAGTFMDTTPAVLILTPMLPQVVTVPGMNPVPSGIVSIANFGIGGCTPPVGTCLFMRRRLGRAKLARVIRSRFSGGVVC